jgi:hypothetical protein
MDLKLVKFTLLFRVVSRYLGNLWAGSFSGCFLSYDFSRAHPFQPSARAKSHVHGAGFFPAKKSPRLADGTVLNDYAVWYNRTDNLN